MKASPYVLVVCLLSWMCSPSMATVGVAIMGPDGTIVDAISNFKTPPLRTSDKFTVIVDKHIPVDTPNWAGYRLKFHILDSKEISVTPDSTMWVYGPGPTGATITTKIPLVPPDFPQSTPLVQSVPIFRTFWDPSAPNSGRFQPASKWVGLASFVLHAKSTNMGQNSDVDMTVMAWCIRHLRGGPGTTQFEQSALVWAHSNFFPTPEQPVPSLGPPPGDPNGHWVHIPFPWHVGPGIGSQFIATFAGTAVIGLEHVPEPITGVLAGSGVLLLFCSWGLRRRRMVM